MTHKEFINIQFCFASPSSNRGGLRKNNCKTLMGRCVLSCRNYSPSTTAPPEFPHMDGQLRVKDHSTSKLCDRQRSIGDNN